MNNSWLQSKTFYLTSTHWTSTDPQNLYCITRYIPNMAINIKRTRSCLQKMYTAHNMLHVSESGHRINQTLTWHRGQDCEVSIVNCSELEGPGTESRWGQDFPQLSRPVLEPTQPPLQRVLGLFPRDKVVRAWSWPPTHPSSTEAKERLELYFHSPSRL